MTAASVLPRVSEKVEQAHIVQLLRSLGGYAFVIGTHRRRGDYQGTMQSPGVPDVIGFVPVRTETPDRWVFVFIECKGRGGRLRPSQIVFRDLCKFAGIPHVVGNLDAVIAWLIERGALKAQQVPHYRQPKEQ